MGEATSKGYAGVDLVERSDVPDHVPPDLVHWLDHHNDPEVLADPVGYLDPLREKYRAFYSPAFEGFWVFTRYEDIQKAFQRPDLFSSRPVGIPGGPGYGGLALLPIELDPPEHKKYRMLINPVFAPKRIAEQEDAQRRLANDLIDRFADGEGCDLIADFARHFPTTVFMQLMGLPLDEADKFLQWNNDLLHSSQKGGGLERKKKAGEDISAYLQQLIEARQAERKDDIVSVLIDSRVDDHQLTPHEVLRASFLLFMAGLDTVISGLGFCFKFLAEHPEHRQQIVDDPDVIPTAVEELLRYHSFVQDARTATGDFEFAGVKIRKGDRVLLATSTAGRDEREFPKPHTIDFTRQPNRHLAFAAGPHRCVGSHLARQELRIALEEWHRRIPDYSLAPDADVTFHGGGVAGPELLPLIFNH